MKGHFPGMVLRADQSFLLVVDVQRKLAPSVAWSQYIIANIDRLMTAAKHLNVLTLVTEHCSDRIGETVDPLRQRIPVEAILKKTRFSAVSDERCGPRLAALRGRKAVVVGMEAHVCVMQTTLELQQAGCQCYIVADAVSSRHEIDRETALVRFRAEAVRLVTTEMVIFEWLEGADNAAFGTLLPLIKSCTEAPWFSRPRAADRG